MIKQKNLNLKPVEIAWLTGLLEGEGYFGIDNRSVKRYKNSTVPASPYITISMIDENFIAKLAKLVNKNYYSPSRKTATSKKVFICHVGDRPTLLYLLPHLLPHISKRRKKQIQNYINLLNQYVAWKNKQINK